ncbi:MAG TPA: outer membrane lipoprotein carrier protein LolA [Stellaceae bacterium]|nr:outer membrane lipoprotein carrier protein LolA [Stellaceae bacterium]
MTAGGKCGGTRRGKASVGRAAMRAAGLALMVTAAPALAAAAVPAATPNAQDVAELHDILAYLNSIHTMTARFTQISSSGRVASGRLWLERPGGMRIEYDPPSPVLLIADRFYVYYVDKDLAQVSQIGLKATPAWFLLRDPIRFGQGLALTGFNPGPDFVRVTVGERAHPDLGSLTMVFSRTPLRLRQWSVVDREGKTTRVTLSQEQFGMALDPNLFQYRNPYTGRSTEP